MGDKYGRKKIIAYFLLTSIGISSIFMNVSNIWVYGTWRLISQAFSTGAFVNAHAYGAEIVPKNYKQIPPVFTGGYSNVIAQILMTVFAWAFRSWYFLYVSFNMIHLVLTLLILFFVPESFRFLISKGRKSEAQAVLKKFYPEDDFAIELKNVPNPDESGDILVDEKKTKKSEGFSIIMKDKNMRMALICISVIWTLTRIGFKYKIWSSVG